MNLRLTLGVWYLRARIAFLRMRQGPKLWPIRTTVRWLPPEWTVLIDPRPWKWRWGSSVYHFFVPGPKGQKKAGNHVLYRGYGPVGAYKLLDAKESAVHRARIRIFRTTDLTTRG